MSKQKTKTPAGVPTLTDVLGANGLSLLPDQDTSPTLPAWVGESEQVILPPNMIELLVVAHRERDAAKALYDLHEGRRDGLFTGFLMAQGLPLSTTYDLATGMATVPHSTPVGTLSLSNGSGQAEAE